MVLRESIDDRMVGNYDSAFVMEKHSPTLFAGSIVAKKRSGKTQAIRNYLEEHPDAMPKDVVSALKRLGVTAQYVSQVKYQMQNEANGKAKRAAAPKATRKKKRKYTRRKQTATTSYALSAEALLDVKDLASRLGGIDKAREALSILERLNK